MSENNYISIKGARVNNLKTSMIFPATSLLSSPDYRVRENHLLLLIRSTQKDNAATWKV